ncbi:putative dynein ATPase [Helianthus annuus]|uniref:Dynein light chain n=1 Tax=Helianthus annuus TaxID=4232 RepID=A0A251RLL4_HELAN|nr:dynein light chain 1, cytoplasmic [Helianthus annuus]KAF5753610.1 putative dynein ATPase [Helianthus annuus]KAJ0431512.1 putative dynein ATPase [Helianthus annuus]KAJ0666175.1 putative dynein ATPase [Helianthus annuus]
MSENPNRSLIGVKPMPSTDDRKTTASPPSISSTSTNRKVIIKSADMKEEMQTEAVNIAISAFEELSVEKDAAEQIKKVFDKNHGPTWHCIVGKNFGSYVTHETNHFVYFYLDSKAVLLFKSG